MTVANTRGGQAGALLDRDAELRALAELVDRVACGRGGVLLIEGAAGIGKTSLLRGVEELADSARARVLRARGGELEQSFAFGLAAQLLGPALAELDAEERASVVAGAGELGVPALEPRDAPETRAADAQSVLHARVYGLYWLCVGLAMRQPLILIVDDAQWADDPSSQWLLFLARRVEDLPVSLILGARSFSAGNWPASLALLRSDPQVSVLRPKPLSRQVTGALIERLFDGDVEDSFIGACHRVTGGNPFLLVELVAAIRADGIAPTAAHAGRIDALAPDGITRSVVVRLGRMSREAQALASAVAVLGAEADFRHAAAVASLDDATAAPAADALVSAELLDRGRPLRLIHPIVRSVLYAELPDGVRAQLHRRAADVLGPDGADPDAVAAHLLASEPAGQPATVDVLTRAAERALSRGATETACAYLQRALGEPPADSQRVAVLRRLAVVETNLGDLAAAEHARRAMKLTPDLRARAELAVDLSYGLALGGRFNEAVAVLERAIAETRAEDRDLGWLLQAQAVSWSRVDPANAPVVRRYLAGVPRDLPGSTRGQRAILAELAYSALTAAEPVEVVADLAQRALAGGRLLDEQPAGSLMVQNVLWTLVLCDRHEFPRAVYDRLIVQYAEQGWAIAFALVAQRRSGLRHFRGEMADALADIHAAVAAATGFGPSLVPPMLFGSLSGLLLDVGDTEGAAGAYASSGIGEDIPKLMPFLTLIASRARQRLARGDTDAGIDDLLTAQYVLIQAGMTNPAGTHYRSVAALALARTGRRDDAQRLVAGELSDARRFGAPSAVGVALRAAGVIEGGAGGIDYLRQAIAELERSPARLEHARALAALGGALRRNGKRAEAQRALREALDLADRCGAKPVAEQAREELVISGARPRRARMTGVEALTPSEWRVAQLAAEGLTNRQIAQALFISHATVVTHLSHCYQKLDIGSREKLATVLADQREAEGL
jgi:DNA-binding CsgD family transcriptional regulator